MVCKNTLIISVSLEFFNFLLAYVLIKCFHIAIVDKRIQEILVTRSTKNNIIVNLYPIARGFQLTATF